MPENFSPDRLAQQMEKLTREMEKRNSFWRALVRGMVRGIGMMIGATVLSVLALTILWRVARGIRIDDLAQKLGVPVPDLPSESIPPEVLEQFKKEGLTIPGSR